jgi:hypothetical protein
LILALALILVAQTPAAADVERIRDGNDSRSPLDIESVVQGHYFEYALYKVISRDRWDQTELKGGKMVFHFNTDGDPRIERRGVLKYHSPRGAQLRLTVFNSRHHEVGRGVFRRPSRRSVEVWFKRRLLGYPEKYRVIVTVATDGCGDKCHDRAPDRGTISHELQPLCGSSEATLMGTEGDDVLHGTDRRDVIMGLAGNDDITDVDGSDLVCAGPGDDVVEGGRGFLFVFGGSGADHISGSGPRPRPCDDTGRRSASCVYPEAVFIGGAGNDTLEGGRYSERLMGEEGNDHLRGADGSDRLDGGDGHDALYGGSGSDYCKRGEEDSSCEY